MAKIKVKVELEFDEELGESWLNEYNLRSLLYSEVAVKEDALKIVSYQNIVEK